jgi:hypothetical protein
VRLCCIKKHILRCESASVYVPTIIVFKQSSR